MKRISLLLCALACLSGQPTWPFGAPTDSVGSCFSTKQCVRAIYRSVLRREAEPSGLEYWVARVDAGELTLAELETTFQNCPEALGEIPGVRFRELRGE